MIVILHFIFNSVPLTSAVRERFLSNHLECRHFRIRCLHERKEILAKWVVILTSKLKYSDETL